MGRARAWPVKTDMSFLVSHFNFFYCNGSFVAVSGEEMRHGLGARLGLTVGTWGWMGMPRPSPYPFTSFYPATSLTTRLASACQGTPKACGTGNLGAPSLKGWEVQRKPPFSDPCPLTCLAGIWARHTLSPSPLRYISFSITAATW